MIAILICGVLVGLALGLTGGGGSIFAVPLLIYALALPMDAAVPVSLLTVALTALFGAAMTLRTGLIAWRPAIIFAAGGVIATPLGMDVGTHMPTDARILAFAVLMLLVAANMWRTTTQQPAETSVVRSSLTAEAGGPVCRLSPAEQLRFSAPCALVLALVGVVTGLLAGVFGVGGGFLIVPALVFVTQMPMQRAVATSLLVIAVIGLVGTAMAALSGHLTLSAYLPITAKFVAGSFIGMAAGRLLAVRIAGPELQKLFAAMVVITAVAMLIGLGLE